jgi:hypothetical protein
MSENHKDIPWLGPEYFKNRQNFPLDELAKYAGQHIAWSWDGSQILASGADEEEVEQKLIAAGVDPSRVVFSYVPPGHVSLLL